MTFFVGMDDIHHAQHLPRTFLSVNRLRRRRSDFLVNDWIMDSGAFTEISTHGRWTTSVSDYALQINRWRRCGNLLAAVAQDMMCEPFILDKSGLSLAEHQRITIERYLHLRILTSVPIMPVIQGFHPDDYPRHVAQYGDDLSAGHWTGVGSVCKRNTDPRLIEYILRKIKAARPDLRLHGFGLKLTALKHPPIRNLLHSADSMAWGITESQNAWQLKAKLDFELGRKTSMQEARKIYSERGITLFNRHDWREAERFVAKIEREQVNMEDFALL